MREISNYVMPKPEMLDDANGQVFVSDEERIRKFKRLEEVFERNNVDVDDIEVALGPTVSEYKVISKSKIKASKISALSADIDLAFGYGRYLRVLPYRDSITVEIPNDCRSVVPMKDLLESETFESSDAELPLAIGLAAGMQVRVIDLAKSPNILVAGATQQGKTVFLHTMIASLLFSKRSDELKMVLIDPKALVFTPYQGLSKHYGAVKSDVGNGGDGPVVTNLRDAVNVLESLCAELESRYETMSQSKVCNIVEYNVLESRRMPYIVCFVDEFADLIMPFGCGDSRLLRRRITDALERLAQSGRAVGIHMVLATNMVSHELITDAIKVNFPTRIAFRTVDKRESSLIVDGPGAEQLAGSGDLLLRTGVDLERLQGGYISSDEIKSVVGYIRSQKGYDSPYCLPTPKMVCLHHETPNYPISLRKL